MRQSVSVPTVTRPKALDAREKQTRQGTDIGHGQKDLEIRLDGTLLADCLPDLLDGLLHYKPDLLPLLAVHCCMGG